MVGTSNSGLVDGKYDDPAHKQRHVASIENRDARREKIRAEIRADPDFYKGERIGNFLVKGKAFHTGSRPRVTSTAVNRTRRGDTSGDMRVKIDGKAYSRKDPAIKYFFLDKSVNTEKLPRAEKREKKFNPETDPVPIPQYEREDKCNDTELKTPPEKKIKKEDEKDWKKERDEVYAGDKEPKETGFDPMKRRYGNLLLKGFSQTSHNLGLGADERHKKTETKYTMTRTGLKQEKVTPSVRRGIGRKDGARSAKMERLGKGEVIDNFLVKAGRDSGSTPGELTIAFNNKKYPKGGLDLVNRASRGTPWEGKEEKKVSKNECPCAGAKVEMEHKDTLMSLGIPEDKIPDAAKKIAADHVKEDPEYYKKLKQMESVHKAEVEPDPEESEIRQLRFKSRLSPSIKDLKEVQEVKEVKKDDIKREWMLDLDTLMKSDREFSGTFHKPVIDKENDIIPAVAMDKAMDDFMVLPTLQEVHTERPVGIITKAWKTGEDEYYLEGKIKPGDDCDDVWQKIKKGEYDGLSIGGRRIKYSKECAIPSLIRDTPCVTHRLKLYNVSVCSSPVNPEASIDEFNKVAKSETGVGEEVFDLTETLKKAMTAGTSSTTGSNLNHGIFDGRKKNVTEDEVDKGAWTSKRGISAGLQQTSMRAAEVRPRMAQKPRNQNRVIRVNRATLPGGKFSKSDILQLIDSINELSKSWSTKAPLGSKGESQHESAKAALKGGNPRRIARASAQTARFREQDKSRDSEMKEFREGKAAAGLRNLTKSDIHQLIDMIGEISKGFVEGSPYKSAHAHGREAKTFRDFNRERDRTREKANASEGLKEMTKSVLDGKVRDPVEVNRTRAFREFDNRSDKEASEPSYPGGQRALTRHNAGYRGLAEMTKSDDDEQKPIRQSEKAKRKEKSQGEDYHDGKLEKGEDVDKAWQHTRDKVGLKSGQERHGLTGKMRHTLNEIGRSAADMEAKEKAYFAKKKVNKGDTMDEDVNEDVENVEKGDDELITKSDIDALTDAIMGLQKSFESYFSTLTVPQPQKLSGKGHEVTDTMQKSEDEIPVNNAEVISKAYDDKIKTLEEKIAKMENTTIRKGGEAVIIPEQLSKDDPVLTNMSILNGIGRMSK